MTDERSIEVCDLVIHSQRSDGRALVAISGDLGIGNADALDRELRRVEATHAAEIVLDLSDLDFIDSTGIRVVYSAYIRSLDSGGRLRVICGPECVQRAFARQGLGQLLPFSE